MTWISEQLLGQQSTAGFLQLRQDSSVSVPCTAGPERRKHPQELPGLVLLTASPAWVWPAQVATSAGVLSGSGEGNVLWQLPPAALPSGELDVPSTHSGRAACT